MYIHLRWRLEVITADHDGYCTDSGNRETVSYINQCFQYQLTQDEYYTLIWLYNECSNLLKSKDFIESVKPKIRNIKIKHNGSDYCDYSITHSLSHEIMKVPTEILSFNVNYEVTNKKRYIANSHNLKIYLNPIIEKNDIINESLNMVLPMEIIDIILKYLWNDI